METVNRRRAAVKAAFPATVPVMTGFLALGVAYGILMRTNGYGPLWSTLMAPSASAAVCSMWPSRCW